MNVSIKLFLVIFLLLSDEIFSIPVVKSLKNNKDSVIQEQNGIQNGIKCEMGNSFCWYLSENYDRKLEPWNHHDAKNESLPYFYNFEFVVQGIQEVDDFKHTIKLEMYFIVKWWEPRVKIIPSFTELEREADKGIFHPISLEYLGHLWTPDLEIYSMNTYQTPEVLGKQMASIKVNEKSIMRYSNHATIIIACKLKFNTYPFDSHHCLFRAGSYSYYDEIVDCNSKLGKWNISDQRSIQYEATIKEMSPDLRTWYTPEHGWATCGFEITLVRPKTQILIEVYLTATSLVIISWLSFVVNPSVIPGRMGMLVTVFLVLINIFIGVKNKSPTSNGLNAADIFLVACIGQVFACLVEYALVLVIYAKPKQEATSASKSSTKVFVEEINKEKVPEWAVKYQKTLLETVKGSQNHAQNIQWNFIDKMALILFPFTFIVFLITYFNKYMN